MSDSAPPRTTHPSFNPPDADVVLISADNVVFKVHKANVLASSAFFHTLFADASPTNGQGDEIPMAEEAEVLEAVLPYCYPNPVEPVRTSAELPTTFWEVLRTFDKYQIGRGLDAVSSAFKLQAARYETSGLPYYLFATNFYRRDLDEAVRVVVDKNVSAAWAEAELRELADDSGLLDDGKLVLLLRRREIALDEARETTLAEALCGTLDDGNVSNLSQGMIADALRFWFDARSFRSVRALREHLRQQNVEPGFYGIHEGNTCGWLPWDELCMVLEKLPLDL